MGYKQHNSPFNSYRNPKRSVTNFDIKDLKPMPDFVTSPRETADGTTDLDSDDKSKESDNTQDFINNANANKSQGRLVGLQDRIDDPNTTPSQRLRLENRKDRVEDRYRRQEEVGKLTNERKSLARDTREERRTDRGIDRQQRILDRQIKRGLITDDQLKNKLIETTDSNKIKGGNIESGSEMPNLAGDKLNYSGDYKELGNFELSDEQLRALSLGPSMKKQNNMKQINRRGSAFPMLQQDAPTDPNAVNPNRAGGALENGVLTNDPTNPQPIDKISAQTNDNQTRFADLASSAGITNPPPVDPNTSMNPMAPGATNTVGDGVGDPFGGAPAKKGDWIQKGIDSGGIKKGGLHKSLGIPEGQKIPYEDKVKASKSSNPKIRKQGELALTFAKMNKGTSMRGPAQRTDPPKETTKPKIDSTSSTPVSKQIEYFNYLKKNNLQDTHKSRENYPGTKKGPSMKMGPHEDKFSVPTVTLKDKSSITSLKKTKKKTLAKGTGSMGEKNKYKSKDKRKGRSLSGNM